MLNKIFNKNKETFQVVYGIFLIVIIPLLIFYNAVFIIKNYNKGLDASLQRQALMLGRTISSLINEELVSASTTEQKINSIVAKGGDLKEISILKPGKTGFTAFASTNKKYIGKNLNFHLYQLAWAQPEGDGLVTDALRIATTEEGKKIVKDLPKDGRYWLVAMPITNKDGEKTSLLTLKISSKIIDDLTLQNRNMSWFLLAIEIVIIILFLMIAVRLWDYALLYKKIKEVDQMKDEFISIASHELRTPVTGIRGYTEMMLDGTFGEISPKMRESLKMMESASGRLAVLVEDLLNVSRIEQGRIEINFQEVNVNETIEEMVKELKIQADKKGLALSYNPLSKNLPKINIDVDRLKQVLVNIIGNSIKYTQKGTVEVRVEEISKGKKLAIKIKDTGIGMSSKDRERLFQKFYRVQNEQTEKITGTGLGLWITKKIVELMGGRIEVDSIKDVGTEFTIVFPVAG